MELSEYQKIILKLGLVENEEADRIFQHIVKLYPECTEESCQKLLGMLALVLPDLDYDKVVAEIFPDSNERPSKYRLFLEFLKGIINK